MTLISNIEYRRELILNDTGRKVTIMGILIKNRYKLVNTLSEGLVSTIWLASDKHGIKRKETNVIVKIIQKKNTNLDIDNIIYFKRIMNILSNVNFKETAKVLDRGEVGDKIFIVMEKIEGIPLSEYLTQYMTVNRKIDIFINIINAIDKIHNLGIAHNNLKPENILIRVDEDGKEEVSIIGFDLSFMLTEDMANRLLEQNINYISPEQLGGISSNIGQESDMYSLGVILYEMLTGKLPITGEDISEFMYNQISKKPDCPSLYNKEIGTTLEQIILKLLEKDPSSRYACTKGLLHDLEQYKKGARHFVLGTLDDNVDIGYNVSMVGRESELAQIEKMFFEMEKNKGTCILIEGGQGIGKKRLLDEFKNTIKGRKTIIIDSSETIVKKNIRYSLISNIIFLVVKEIKKKSQDEQVRFVSLLRKKIREIGGFLINISPVLEDLLGKYSVEYNVNSEERISKEYTVLDIFFENVMTLDKSLVMFVDKIDLVDKESLEYLKYFTGKMYEHRIMILATCKNEVKGFSNAKIITLNLLDYMEVNTMVSELLNYNSDRTEKITDIVYKKSGGNPKYTLQILKQLINQNIICKVHGEWLYNENKIKEKDIIDSFLDVQIKEILGMSDDELYVLTIFASIGKEIYADVLIKVLKRNKESIMLMIDKFCDLKIIEFGESKYRFSNEKIREALIERVKGEDEKILHAKIAKSLEEEYGNDREYILNIYEHYKKADNKEKMEEYVKKVKEFNVYNLDSKLALECFEDILRIRNDTEYKKMVAKIHYMLGELDIAASIFEELYSATNNPKDRIDIIVDLINIYDKKREYAVCEEYISMAFKILNIKIPKNRFVIWLDYINESTMIIGEKEKKDEGMNKLNLYIALASYYKEKDKIKSKYFAQKQYNIMKQLQNDKNIEIEAINAFHEYCRSNSTRLLDITISEENEIKHRYQIAYTYKLYGEYYERKGKYKEAIDKYIKSANLYKAINNDFCYYKMQSKIFDNDYKLSLYNDAMEINKNYDEFVSNGYEQYKIKAYSNFLKIYIDYNDTKNIDEYRNKIKDFIRDNDNIDIPLYIYALKVLGIMELENGEKLTAIDYFKNILLLKNNDASIYLYLAEAYIDQLFSNDRFVLLEKNVIIGDTSRLLKLAKKLSSKPQRGRYYYQRARLYEFMGKNTLANEYYNASIKLLNKFSEQYLLARVYKDYAEFLNNNGEKEKCNDNLEKAYIIFSRIGARKYIDKIKKHFNLSNNENERLSMLRKIKYASQLEIILKLNQHISSMLNIQDLLDKVLKIAIRYTGAEGGYIFTIDRNTNYINKTAHFFNSNEVCSNNILKLVQTTGKALLISNACYDERFLSDRSVLENNIKSVMAVPIKYGESIKGICYLSNTLAQGVFNERDLELLELLMSQTAISLENAELYEMAITDGLTKLMTRKYFMYIASKELGKCIRYGRIMSIGMLDIDHFKKFNDTYGHQAGDYVLAEVAKIAKEMFRLSDSVARYGGEEFIILMPETDVDGGYIACERLRKEIENKVFSFGEYTFSVTVSIGIAEIKNLEQTIEELIKASDLALYQSKENGRNRVTKSE